MAKAKTIIIFLFLFTILVLACREVYDPPAISAENKFLVVEGFVNSGQDSTSITLSRSRKLVDTGHFTPELHASVFVEAKNGGSYIIEGRGNGVYKSGPLPLQPDEKYRLRIVTEDGRLYTSDYVAVTTTPAIDSITWKRDEDIFIYVNTHDANNATRYYRWDFTETWEYHSFYESGIGFKNGMLYYIDSADQIYTCWNSNNSTDILLGTSEKLGQDIIKDQFIAKIPNGSGKLNYKYSILVRQYALTRQAFDYWQLLEKSSQQTGTLFDSQPSELIGNIHCETNPAEPVIGFFSVSAIQSKRMYIRRGQVTGWPEEDLTVTCMPFIFPSDSAAYYLVDTAFSPAYYVSGGGLAVARNKCIDCRLKGGTTKKPSFWQ